MADKFIDLTNYDFLAATVKKNDNQYIVTSLKGQFFENLDECKKLNQKLKFY